MTNNLLHIVQEAPHEPMKIYCTPYALGKLCGILEGAIMRIQQGEKVVKTIDEKSNVFFPSDGEGYNIEIHLADWDTISKLPSPYYTETVNQYIEAIKKNGGKDDNKP